MQIRVPIVLSIRFTIVLCLIGERLFLGVHFSKEIAGSVVLLTLGTLCSLLSVDSAHCQAPSLLEQMTSISIPLVTLWQVLPRPQIRIAVNVQGLSCVVQAAWLVIMKKISLGSGVGKTISSTGTE